MQGLYYVCLCLLVGAPFTLAGLFMQFRSGGSLKVPTWEYEPVAKYLYFTGWALSFGTLAVYFSMTAK